MMGIDDRIKKRKQIEALEETALPMLEKKKYSFLSLRA
jgi:hypothetical protein